MKKQHALLILLSTLLSVTIYAASTLSNVIIPVEHIYSPKGFDSNDNTQVVISGYLPNLCYKSPSVKTVINNDKVLIQLTALQSTGTMCAEMIVPFIRTVDLGVLKSGEYSIFVNKGTAMERSSYIYVAKTSNANIDDHIYAGVHSIAQDASLNIITLNGYNPSDCLVYDKTVIIDNGRDTYSVMPIMKQVSSFCPMKMTPFSYDVELPTTLGRQKNILLHVRSMEGQSVNSLFYQH